MATRFALEAKLAFPTPPNLNRWRTVLNSATQGRVQVDAPDFPDGPRLQTSHEGVDYYHYEVAFNARGDGDAVFQAIIDEAVRQGAAVVDGPEGTFVSQVRLGWQEDGAAQATRMIARAPDWAPVTE